MRSQEELLAGTEIPSDTLPNHIFTEEDLAFLAVAEGIANIEWSKACGAISLSPNVDVIPINYDALLKRQGEWTLDYSS